MIGLHSSHLRMRLVMVAPLVVEVGTKPTQIVSLTLWRDSAVQWRLTTSHKYYYVWSEKYFSLISHVVYVI